MIIFELSYYILKSTYDNQQIDQNKLYLRKEALKKAKIFLSPYNDIWSNLRLSNKYCYLKLGAVPDDIVGGEKVGLKRKFRVITSEVYTFEDLWNMFCKYFNANKRYEGLLEDCNRFKLIIEEELAPSEKIITNSEYERKIDKTDPIISMPIQSEKQEETEPATKIDINNCSEIELTELPGISIVQAKKVIKKREEIDGFKSNSEFFNALNLKPHLQNQINDRICINKMKGYLNKVERYEERQIDI